MISVARGSTHKGITLIEVLVVVAIIAFLIAVLLPSFTSAREQAKQTVCLSNMRQMGIAAGMYADENDDYFPLSEHGSQDAAWIRAMQPQGGDDQVYRCPSDESGDWFNPADSAAQQLVNDRRASYGLSIYISPTLKPPPGAPDPTPRYGYERRTYLRRPAETVLFGEFVETDGNDVFADHIHADQWLPHPLTGVATAVPKDEVAIERHREKSNYTMADGHTAWRDFETTFKLDEASGDVLVDEWNPRKE